MESNSNIQQKIKSESFNIQKAIDRLQWRFKNENVKVGESKITINELDQKAINFLITWVNDQKQETLRDNELFAKIFCMIFYEEINFYKEPKFALRSIQERLNLPIEMHYDKIHKVINQIELDKYLTSVGIIVDHTESLLLTQKQNDEQNSLLKKHSKEIEIKLKGVWSKPDIYKSLNNTITELINKFKNK